jgi:hypothetical protein
LAVPGLCNARHAVIGVAVLFWHDLHAAVLAAGHYDLLEGFVPPRPQPLRGREEKLAFWC